MLAAMGELLFLPTLAIQEGERGERSDP